MRILYGVTGEGMGHATRSRVILEHLLTSGHEIHVVVSGRAHKFLTDRFAGRERIKFHEIHGLHLDYHGNKLDVPGSVLSNLLDAPAGFFKNIGVYFRMDFDPQAVVSDFESWAYLFGVNHFLPVFSIDNMQVIDRCAHGDEIERSSDYALARAAVTAKLPGCRHYLITTFFHPPVVKERTTLVPPILRPEILAAKREPGQHVVVYQTAASNAALIPMLQSLPYEFRVYGMGREGREGNVSLRLFSERGFIDDLRTARAVLAGGGFSLMSECVHLRLPMYSVPLEGQFEQELNARYLAALGYGAWSPRWQREPVERFLAGAPPCTSYVPQDNSKTCTTLDGLLAAV